MEAGTTTKADRNYATLTEAVADAAGERTALARGARRISWRQLDDRAARLAEAFRRLGVGYDSKVACYLHNCSEYLESVIGAFKLRAVPVNVNYRYVADELEYLLENSDTEVLLFHGSLAERVASVRDRLPKLRAVVQVDDGSPMLDGALPYEQLLSEHEPMDRIPRSSDDLLFIYTGGTTGMPKGVMWRCADLLLGPGVQRAFQQAGVEPPEGAHDIGERVSELADKGLTPVHLPVSPLMHGAGLGSSLGSLLFGGTVVTLESIRFDPHELWQTVEREGVTQMTIVGDPFARPMVRALEDAEAGGRPYDLSSVRRIQSTGAMWSATTKRALQERGDMILQDGLASTEALAMGVSVTEPGKEPETAKFQIGQHSSVITEDGREVEPGSGEVGLLAVSHPIPAGYYKDPEKTERTFRTVAGKRYAIPGDWARVEEDGTIILLGRGSVCINTGGEKVFPEEVEEVLKEHPDVTDCVVVGVPDEKWGETVTAVTSLRDGASATVEELRSVGRDRLATYKLPKHVVLVDEVYRAPSGKADYAWARRTAAEYLGLELEEQGIS